MSKIPGWSNTGKDTWKSDYNNTKLKIKQIRCQKGNKPGRYNVRIRGQSNIDKRFTGKDKARNYAIGWMREHSKRASKQDNLSKEERMNLVKKLTQKGLMVGKSVPKDIKESDIRKIEKSSAPPMYVNGNLLRLIRSGRKGNANMKKIKVTSSVPKFTGVDKKVYSLKKGRTQEVPEDNAEILVNRGNAEYVEDSNKVKNQPKSTSSSSSSNSPSSSSNSTEYNQTDKAVKRVLSDGESHSRKEIYSKVDSSKSDVDDSLEKLSSYGELYQPAKDKYNRI